MANEIAKIRIAKCRTSKITILVDYSKLFSLTLIPSIQRYLIWLHLVRYLA